jgi:protein-tyrosine-phosphatase
MAAELLKRELSGQPIEILSRGLIVQFPEPLNQKAEAVMAADGIVFDSFETKELKNGEITDKTLIFTMNEKQRVQIIDRLPSANEENTFVLAYYVGEELETMNPYGGSLQSYGLCYETLKETTKKLAKRILEENGNE